MQARAHRVTTVRPQARSQETPLEIALSHLNLTTRSSRNDAGSLALLDSF